MKARMHRSSVTWRYLPEGRVRHALRDVSDTVALCGIGPWTSDQWYGTGAQVEYETVEALPECKHCARRLGGAS